VVHRVGALVAIVTAVIHAGIVALSVSMIVAITITPGVICVVVAVPIAIAPRVVSIVAAHTIATPVVAIAYAPAYTRAVPWVVAVIRVIAITIGAIGLVAPGRAVVDARTVYRRHRRYIYKRGIIPAANLVAVIQVIIAAVVKAAVCIVVVAITIAAVFIVIALLIVYVARRVIHISGAAAARGACIAVKLIIQLIQLVLQVATGLGLAVFGSSFLFFLRRLGILAVKITIYIVLCHNRGTQAGKPKEQEERSERFHF
jgi:hypothetical protein